MQYKLKGKTIIISGIARGIGKALALNCASLGMNIAGIDIKQKEINELTKELNEIGVKHFLAQIDIRNLTECEKFIEACYKQFGSIDVLINNAGITHIAPENETSIEDTKNVMDINFMGVVHLSHTALPYIIKSKGVIAAISSVAGYSPLLYRTAYAASKHAVWGYMASLRGEMKDKGLQVLTICPSFVKTDLQENQQKYFVNNTNVALTPTYVANEILRAIIKKQDVVFIGKTAKQIYLLHRFFPKLYEKIMIRKTKLN